MRLSEQQLETAARKLCELRGIDPDQSTPHNAPPDENGWVPMVQLYSPAWRIVAGEIQSHLQIQEAINFAMEQSGELTPLEKLQSPQGWITKPEFKAVELKK